MTPTDRPNIPVPDQLAGIREQIRALETHERELKEALIANPDIRMGANWLAEVKTVTTQRVDLKELRAMHADLVDEYTFPAEVTRVVLSGIIRGWRAGQRPPDAGRREIWRHTVNAITTTSPHPLRPQNFSELMEFAKMAARSTLVPRDYLGKPENIVLAIQMGSEIGLAPMQSLQNISVINGRPSVWGDAMLGLCRQSPACKDVVECFEGEGKELTAICVAKRVGAEPIERRFSMDDAVRAGLASKAGTWQQYPQRMLQMRARGFALRDAFPDVLKGLIAVEEAQDIPEEKFAGKTIESTASDERSAINDAVPLKAAAAPMPRGARVAERATPYEAPRPHPQMPSGPVDPNPVDASTHVQGDIYDQHNIAIELLDVGDSRSWMSNLEMLLAEATSLKAVEVIGECESVKRTIEKAPGSVRARVSELLAKACKRFIENDPAHGEELPDVEIEGERNVMAGD